MAIDKFEYLKKYTSRATKEKKKKDHKDSRLTIIEIDAFLPVNSKVSDDEEEDDIEIRALNEEIHQKIKKGGARGGFKSTFVEIEDEVKKEIKEDSNQSSSHQIQPSARKRHDSDSDISPSRKENRVRANVKDLSPPSKKIRSRSPANSSTRKRHDSDSDLSPPRKHQKSRDDSGDLSPPRRRKGASIDHVSSPRHKNTTTKYEKTLDGKKAGLQNSKDLREESNKIRKEESRIFEQLDDSVTGRNSNTRVRTNQRKSKGNEKDLEKKKREAEKQLELEEKYRQWNKGLLQQKEREEQLEEMRRVAEGPMTRRADDKDMNRYLKEQILTEDPMASLIMKRNREEAIDRGELVYPIYEKSFPPNRYSIRPGYRWDGVDRSNGFESKLMASRNMKEASKHDDFVKWQNVEA